MPDDTLTPELSAKPTVHTRLKLLLEWHRAAAVQMAAKGDIARKERHEGFEQTVRDAMKALSKREKAKPGVRPTKEEVLLYADEIRLPSAQADRFFDHFESNGWKQGGKTPMKDWMAAMRNWRRRWADENPQAAKSMQTAAPGVKIVGDPPKWGAFLAVRGIAYEPYAHTRGYLKTEFSEWLKKSGK